MELVGNVSSSPVVVQGLVSIGQQIQEKVESPRPEYIDKLVEVPVIMKIQTPTISIVQQAIGMSGRQGTWTGADGRVDSEGIGDV